MSSDNYKVSNKIPLKEGYQPKQGDSFEKGYKPNQGNFDRNDPPRPKPESSSSDSESDS